MGARFLVDSNVLIYFLTDDIAPAALTIVETILNESFQISILSKIEVLGWRGHTPDGYEATAEFLKHADVFDLTSQVADYTIELRRQFSIKLPDAVIAATALLHDLTLVTRNTKDFARIENLKLLNPFDASENLHS
jgi:predicted nucleic acid-binding protein